MVLKCHAAACGSIVMQWREGRRVKLGGRGKNEREREREREREGGREREGEREKERFKI